ncbi:MAG: hypothetical protein ACOX9R_02515 [Armatimonadota bacterium]|jgi:hypothetical protein
MARTTRLEIRNERTSTVIEHVNAEIERWVKNRLVELKATHRTRAAAEGAYDRVIRSRKWLVVPRHSEEERFFLRQMLLYLIALKPGLQARANEVASYLSTNYPYEWVQSDVTRLAIARARDMILSSAESEFGETPMSGPLGFVYHHHNTLKVRNVSHYGECYALAANLVRQRHFLNQDQPWREKLGLHRLHAT